MGKLVVTEFLSIDGVMEDPGGTENFNHGGWSLDYFSDEISRFKTDELFASDAHLLGRVTYEGFAKAWPNRAGNEFADYINAMPKYVVSNTLDSLEWNNSHLIQGDVAEDIGKLKDQFGKDILVAGSCQLVSFLARHDLVDEYRLMVHPVVLGSGKRLFESGVDITRLKLAGTQTLEKGNVVLTYEPARGSGESA